MTLLYNWSTESCFHYLLNGCGKKTTEIPFRCIVVQWNCVFIISWRPWKKKTPTTSSHDPNNTPHQEIYTPQHHRAIGKSHTREALEVEVTRTGILEDWYHAHRWSCSGTVVARLRGSSSHANLESRVVHNVVRIVMVLCVGGDWAWHWFRYGAKMVWWW